MRKLAASHILRPEGALQENCTLIMDGDKVKSLVNEVLPDAELFSGIILPGFINSHCHLELSHLKNKINPHSGLDGFIREFVEARKTYTHGVLASAESADAQMWENGIQGVGDICNTDITFPVKAHSRIRYHNFIELFNMDPAQAADTIHNGVKLGNASLAFNVRASLVPHAPYSVPESLLRLIQQHHNINKSWWSIHNMESYSENDMFIHGKGKLVELFHQMGAMRTQFEPTGKSSMSSVSEFLPTHSNLLFIHNTFVSQNEINFPEIENARDRTWFGFCVKANLYIEERVPDIPLFIKNGCKITVGTDSLASNDTLSVLEELKAIHKSFPQIEIATLLTWATRNGAEYFGWEDLGSFQEGNRPGVILITDCNNQVIGNSASIRRIV